MAIRTPEPRLPLEPEEYPLYRPPRRVGCSGLSIVTLLMLAVFAFIFWRVTPGLVQGISSFDPKAILAGSADTTATPGDGAMETQTALPTTPIPTSTVVAITTPTAVRQCAKVTGTSGQGTPLYEQALLTSKKVIPAGRGGVQDGATFQVIGPEITAGVDKSGKNIVWSHVILPGDGRTGYILAKYLQPAPCP